MYDGQKIIVGLLVFLALASIPFWYTPAAGKAYEAPNIKLPEGECVESRDYMRASHMELLNNWRDDVVRLGSRVHVSKSGKKYLKTLTGTTKPKPVPPGSELSGVEQRGCLGCHSQTAAAGESEADSFCLECHQKSGVEMPKDDRSWPEDGRLTCWGCHHESPDQAASQPAASKPAAPEPAPGKPAASKGGAK